MCLAKLFYLIRLVDDCLLIIFCFRFAVRDKKGVQMHVVVSVGCLHVCAAQAFFLICNARKASVQMWMRVID